MRQATKWFNILTTRVPTDPGILARLGQIYSREEDEAQAFHYHLEAYRYFPVNMEVISWLGAYFVKNELYEKAMQFFERAAQIQPEEVKVRVRRSLQQQCCSARDRRCACCSGSLWSRRATAASRTLRTLCEFTRISTLSTLTTSSACVTSCTFVASSK